MARARPPRLIYTHGQIRRRMAFGGTLMLPGLLWFLAPSMWWNNLQLTGFCSLWFGASVGAMLKYRTERGLWMLAVLFAPIPAGLNIWFWYDSVFGGSSGSILWWNLADTTIATGLLWLQVRFLMSTGYHNFNLRTRSTRDYR